MPERFTDEVEAKALLAGSIEEWRTRTYAELAGKLGSVNSYLGGRIQTGGPPAEHVEVTAASGVIYDVATIIGWDGREPKDVRVIVTVAELHPRWDVWCSDSFIVGPGGVFVGE